MTAHFAVELLSGAHDRSSFQCGHERIDRYFRQIVTQDVKRNYATCYVAVDTSHRIAGFFTLSAHSIPLPEIPPDFARKLPPYPNVPAVLIGWLGVDQNFQGQRLGSMLVFDAVTRIAHSTVGAHALLADAIDERAASFYEKLGFIAFNTKPRTLFLPISAAVKRLPK